MYLENYFDFAENDYRYFHPAMKNTTTFSNAFGSISQNICERYIKHIIDEFDEPQNEREQARHDRVLKAHSLRVLIGYCRNQMGIKFDEEVEDKICRIDGYYFSTRYPNENSYTLSERDIIKCRIAIEVCRETIMNLTVQLAKDHNREIPLPEDVKMEIVDKYTTDKKCLKAQINDMPHTIENAAAIQALEQEKSNIKSKIKYIQHGPDAIDRIVPER